MSEKRLLEIVSTVSMLDGPLVVFGYLLSLKYSEMYLFLNYVKGSKYKDINFYEAIKMFSRDYLVDRELIEGNLDFERFGYKEGNYDDYFINCGLSQDYLKNCFGVDSEIKVGNYKK